MRLSSTHFLLGCAVALGCFSSCAGIRPVPEVIKAPVLERKLLGRFQPSFYCLADESDQRYVGQPKDAPVLDIYGQTIAMVSREFKRKVDLEGSGKLSDGRVINFAQRASDGIRYRLVQGAPWGLGAANVEYLSRAEPYKLIPYRSVAVDPGQIDLGSVLYIPKAKGILLPEGSTHDGYFLAHDVGGAIKGNRLDLFVGMEEDVRNTFTRNGLTNMSPIEVYLVPEPEAEEIRSKYRAQYTLTTKKIHQMIWKDVNTMLANINAAEPDLDRRMMFFSERAKETPYLIFCLGEGPSGLYDKDPLVDIARVDCMTFCEQILALSISKDYQDFFQNLQKIRYRDGIVDFKMRNHHTIADWLPNNSWLLEDVTILIGGPLCRPMTKTIDRAKDMAAMGCDDMRDIPPAQTITVQYIPKEYLLQVAENLHGGEIASIIQKREGIFSSHMGLIARDVQGKVIFRHASRNAEKVIDESYEEYVKKLIDWENTSGMIFMRIRRDFHLALGKEKFGEINEESTKHAES